HNLGSWAEVVSSMEYEMAKRLGVKSSHIVFNGPFKPYQVLKEVISDGAVVNVDNLDEIYDLEKIALDMEIKIDIGIRVNMALGTYMAWDRFGFSLESGSAFQAARRAVSGEKINITGLHAHIGTFILDADIYRIEVEKLIEFSKKLKDELGVSIKYIDIGGGFASHNSLKGTYLSTVDNVPSFDRYAEAICEPLLSHFKPDELPLLILETGRALIDEAGILVTTVCATKRLNNGMRAIIVDAGVNLLFTSFWYNHEIISTVDRGYPMEDHVIYGPLCMQIDVIRPQIKLPYLEKKDAIIIRPVGAYNNTQWMQFIHLRPKVVMISSKGEVSIIRETETVDYLQELERLP
ncbi:MAG: diaminopimelate decarboxylase, partial [Bdellovibrio sp.]|nr:diaminopimelate decarboxylase [Bdellovibrio sp.]